MFLGLASTSYLVGTKRYWIREAIENTCYIPLLILLVPWSRLSAACPLQPRLSSSLVWEANHSYSHWVSLSLCGFISWCPSVSSPVNHLSPLPWLSLCNLANQLCIWILCLLLPLPYLGEMPYHGVWDVTFQVAAKGPHDVTCKCRRVYSLWSNLTNGNRQ